MDYLEKQLRKILEERGLEFRDNFKRNILDYQKPPLPHVLAAATSAGKTYLTAAKFELYYKCGIIKPTEKVLILASSLTILRDNFVGQFDSFGVESFTYRGIEHHSELEQAQKDKIQVLITIPQTIEKHTDKIKNVKWVVVDEAHKWYFAATIKRIISNLNIKYQFLLTGTPFKFNRRKEEFIIDYTSVRDLYECKMIDDVKLQVLHSSVALTQLDYVSMLGHLKDEKRIGKSELIESLNGVIKQLIKILKLPNKSWASVNNVSRNYLNVFGKMEKTIIYTNGISEANCVYECLKLNKVNVLVSHSEHMVNGKKENPIETFNNFRNDDTIKVLVTVDRGKEGFNFPELYNIIDFSYTQDFATCLQMIGRLLRKSNGKTEKVFYKIAPKNTSSYFTDWMNYLIQLFDNEWYQRYDGTNGRQIRVPNVLLSSNEETTTTRTGGTRRTMGEFNPINLDNTGMISLSFMDNNKWFKSSDVLSTVATTSLGEIITKFFNLKKPKGYWTKENIIKEALRVDKNGERIYKTSSDFQKNCYRAYKYGNDLKIIYTDCKFIHQKGNLIYDEKTAIEEAKQYKNRTELASKDRKLWDYLTKNNLFDKAKKIIYADSKPNSKRYNIDIEDFYNWCQKNKIKSAKKFKKEGGYKMSYTTLMSNIPNFNWNDFKYKN
jgi:superfamily II DNA or RNA helicase